MQSESCVSSVPTAGEIDVETLAVIETEVQLKTPETGNIGNVHANSTMDTSLSIENGVDSGSLVAIEEVIQLQRQQLCNQDVVQSIAKKESEILSMIMLNNKEAEQAVANVKVENSMGGDGEALISNAEIVTGQNTLNHNNDDVEMVNSENVVTMEFHAADAAWITLFDSFEFVINDCRIRGYVEGEKKFLCLWECFQTSTMSTFTVRSSDRYYKEAMDGEEGSIQGRILKGAPKWSRIPLISYDGVPFVSIDRKYFGCRLGGSERKNNKKGQFKTSRTGHSVKVGCPAEADVLEVWRVPDLAVPDDLKSSREKRRLKSKLLSKVYDYILLEKFTKRYYVTLPLITRHQNHPVLDIQAGRLKVLHPKIIEQIYEIVSQGIYEKRVVKYMLHEYVQEFQNQLGIEIQLSDRSFYPTDRDISNHIRNARHLCKKDDVVMDTATHADSVVVGVEGCEEHLTSVVSSFTEIPSTCDVTYGITNIDSANLFQKTTESNTAFVETIAESNIPNFNENVDSTEKSYLTTEDVNTCSIEDIVQSSMLDLMQNSNATAETTDADGTIATSTTMTTIKTSEHDDITTSEHDEIRTLIEEAKKHPNPPRKKRMRRWPEKPFQKQIDMKLLLKTEIDNSFSVINQALVNETDEAKLKVVLKKVKVLQRLVQGKEAVKKRGKRCGIQAMVDIENLKEITK